MLLRVLAASKWVSTLSCTDTGGQAGFLDHLVLLSATSSKAELKKSVRASMLRWHPDKFAQLFGRALKPDARTKIGAQVRVCCVRVRARRVRCCVCAQCVIIVDCVGYTHDVKLVPR